MTPEKRELIEQLLSARWAIFEIRDGAWHYMRPAAICEIKKMVSNWDPEYPGQITSPTNPSVYYLTAWPVMQNRPKRRDDIDIPWILENLSSDELGELLTMLEAIDLARDQV